MMSTALGQRGLGQFRWALGDKQESDSVLAALSRDSVRRVTRQGARAFTEVSVGSSSTTRTGLGRPMPGPPGTPRSDTSKRRLSTTPMATSAAADGTPLKSRTEMGFALPSHSCITSTSGSDSMRIASRLLEETQLRIEQAKAEKVRARSVGAVHRDLGAAADHQGRTARNCAGRRVAASPGSVSTGGTRVSLVRAGLAILGVELMPDRPDVERNRCVGGDRGGIESQPIRSVNEIRGAHWPRVPRTDWRTWHHRVLPRRFARCPRQAAPSREHAVDSLRRRERFAPEALPSRALAYSPCGSTTTMLAACHPPLTKFCNSEATALVFPEPVEPTIAAWRTTNREASRETGTSSAAANRPRRTCSSSGCGNTDLS